MGPALGLEEEGIWRKDGQSGWQPASVAVGHRAAHEVGLVATRSAGARGDFTGRPLSQSASAWADLASSRSRSDPHGGKGPGAHDRAQPSRAQPATDVS